MILNKKGIIKQFNPPLEIFQVSFVVVIGEMEEEMNALYQHDEEGKWDHMIPLPYKGCTYRVRERETGIPCVLIWIDKKEAFTYRNVAEVCALAAFEICHYSKDEVSFTTYVPFCGLIGSLVKLAVECFHEIPGVMPPVVSKDAFENPTVVKKSKTNKKK